MSKLAGGWEIVCPDGALRHFPYHNLGDAEFDAKVLAERGCEHWDEARRDVPCPGGGHTVRSTVFDDTPRADGKPN